MASSQDVELLRRAAMLMRERALAADTDDARRPYGRRDADPVPREEWGPLVDNYLGGEIGQHCAAWNPATATAVADLLGVIASWAENNAAGHVAPVPLRIASAYLGVPLCDVCARAPHADGAEHPLPTDHLDYDAFYDARDEDLAAMASEAIQNFGDDRGAARRGW